MKLIAVLFILVTYSVNGQEDCDQSELSYEQIKKKFPFSESSKIKLVSYELDLPIVDGRLDSTKLFEQVYLTLSLEKRLLDILANYSTKQEWIGMRTNCEFSPRNGIVFMDKNGNQFEVIEICFECHQIRVSQKEKDPKGICFQKDMMLKEFFRKVGIKYGTN